MVARRKYSRGEEVFTSYGSDCNDRCKHLESTPDFLLCPSEGCCVTLSCITHVRAHIVKHAHTQDLFRRMDLSLGHELVMFRATPT